MKLDSTYSLLSTILILLFSLPLMAQKEATPISAKNAVYLELVGSGLLYSLNYDRIFYQKGWFKSAARIGFSALPKKFETETYWNAALPLELLGMYGRSEHHLEFGVGYTPYYYASAKHVIVSKGDEFDQYRLRSIVPFRVGYRYQKADGGLVFRIGFLPALDFMPGWPHRIELMRGGLSIGKSF